MKSVLAKISFALFSALIVFALLVVLALMRATGEENWLPYLLTCLAAVSAIWALAGLHNPHALFFAHPKHQTRDHAFGFPFRLFCIFALCATLETNTVPGGRYVTIFVGTFLLTFAAYRVTALRNPRLWIGFSGTFPDRLWDQQQLLDQMKHR